MIDQSALLRHLNRMAQHHPRYAELLTAQGVSMHTAALSELPLLTSQRLESIYYGQKARLEPGLTVYRTSGTSTGVSRTITYSPEDESHYRHAKKTCYREWLDATSAQVPICKAFADVGTGHAASTAVDIFAELGLQTRAISFAEPIESHVAQLTSYRPELLYTMPSILEAIARTAAHPASLGIRKIILVGEVASPAWQANMAARFGIEPLDILDTYGSIEVGAIAAYSHRHDAYLFSEGIYAESLPPQQLGTEFDSLAADEGVLVLTSLQRTLFPVIRYVTYDVIRDLHTVVVDGKPRQAFRCIVSRIGSELKHGEKISLYDIENVVHTFVQDAELRVRVRDNKLTVHIRSDLLTDEQLPAIRHGIEHKIPAIGQMIAGRMLERMEVVRLAEHEPWGQGSVKSKKLFS